MGRTIGWCVDDMGLRAAKEHLFAADDEVDASVSGDDGGAATHRSPERALLSQDRLDRTETSSVAGRNQTVVSKSAAKALVGLVSLEKIRIISGFPSMGELNLHSFAADLDTSGFPGARSVPGAAGGVLLKARVLLLRLADNGVMRRYAC